MDWGALISLIAPAVITFLLGLFSNKPGYKKGKNVGKVLMKALEDDKITAEEIQEIIDAYQGK